MKNILVQIGFISLFRNRDIISNYDDVFLYKRDTKWTTIPGRYEFVRREYDKRPENDFALLKFHFCIKYDQDRVNLVCVVLHTEAYCSGRVSHIQNSIRYLFISCV